MKEKIEHPLYNIKRGVQQDNDMSAKHTFPQNQGGGSEASIEINKGTIRLDDIQIESWKCLGEVAGIWLTMLFNKILMAKKMPDE